MTRINCVPVTELTDKHLIAEYRELPRVFGLVRRAAERGETPSDYRVRFPKYTMGEGHVRFFYPRLLWLTRRHQDLVIEMMDRGFEPQYTKSLRVAYSYIPREWWGDWEPSASARLINRQRIAERISK